MTTPPPSPVPPTREGTDEPPPRSPLALGAIALVAVAGVSWWLLRPSAPDAEIAASSETAPSGDGADTELANPDRQAKPPGSDTTKELLDAAQRAQAWHTDAVLAEVRATFVDGALEGPRREGPLEVQ